MKNKTIDEIYNEMKCPILNNTHQKYSAMSRERRFIEAGKLYRGDENILVLVPHGPPEILNSYSLQFWHLQEILIIADHHEDPDSFEDKNPVYTLMDPTFEERYKKDGSVQQQIEKADIVLELTGFSEWAVIKTPYFKIDPNFLYILKLPEVTLDELLIDNPKDIWVYIDERQVDFNVCERMFHGFSRNMTEMGHDDIKLHLMTGCPSVELKMHEEIVLMATPIGFFVDTARQSSHTRKLLSKEELFGYNNLDSIIPTLTSQCRTEFSRKSMLDINIADAYPKPGEPLNPDDDPSQAYVLSAQPEEARVQLELAELSIKRFGYILTDPETGLAVSKEEQDKYVQAILDAANNRKN